MSFPRSDFRFFERLRVRWAEVDMQKIVFNGHYLMYFDTAVAGYWRALAMPYHETMAVPRRRPVRAQGHARVRGSARYDDQLDVGVRCAAHRQLVDGARRRGVPRRTAAGQRRAGLRLRRPGDADVASRCRRSCASCCRPSRPASRWSTCASGAGASSASRRATIRITGVRRGAADPGRDGVGRRRRRLRARGGLQPLRPAAGHRPPARARARRGQDRPHGGAGADARQPHRPRGARRAAAARARSAATARRCCTRNSAPRRSTAAPASSRAGRCSTRPASRTSRWCARCSAL